MVIVIGTSTYNCKNMQEKQMKTYQRGMGCSSKKGQKEVCDTEGAWHGHRDMGMYRSVSR